MDTSTPDGPATRPQGIELRSGGGPLPSRDRRHSSPSIKWTLNAARVDRERILRGFTQHELAGAAFVDPGTLSALLNGRRRPQLGTIGAIAKALELAIPDLVDFD